jgi:hypothetical protein
MKISGRAIIDDLDNYYCGPLKYCIRQSNAKAQKGKGLKNFTNKVTQSMVDVSIN